MPELWPHQSKALRDLRAAVSQGHKTIALAAPTGSGKTVIMAELAGRAAAKGKKVIILTNRRIILGQTSDTLAAAQVQHGVIAAGERPNRFADIHVASVQTLGSRILRTPERYAMELPEADMVIVDEGHANMNGEALTLLLRYKEKGVLIITFTATPVGLGALYGKLIVVAQPQELIAQGILVPCTVYAPNEPDMTGISRKAGEYVQKQMAQRVKETMCFGDVFDTFKELNPWHRPTVVWAPGIAESKWLTEEFTKRGVTAAHIDGKTPQDEREQIFNESRDRTIQVICSCGVLREGWDAPWIQHGILLQVCGSVKNYIQIAGRLLRRYDGKDAATLQDHSGAIWRHGRPDADRHWELNDTDVSIAKERKEKCQDGSVRQDICCPKCGCVRAGGEKCPGCGHEHKQSLRRIRMTDGTLQEVRGPAVKVKRRGGSNTSAVDMWRRELIAGKYSNRTIRACRACFKWKHGYWPPDRLMPRDRLDMDRLAVQVYPWLQRIGKRAKKQEVLV